MKKLMLSMCVVATLFSCKKEMPLLENVTNENQNLKGALYVIDQMEVITPQGSLLKRNYVFNYDANQKLVKVKIKNNNKLYADMFLSYNTQGKISLLKQKRVNIPLAANDRRYFNYDSNGNLTSIKQSSSTPPQSSYSNFTFSNNKIIGYDAPLYYNSLFGGTVEIDIRNIVATNGNTIASDNYKKIKTSGGTNWNFLERFTYKYESNIKNPFKSLNLSFNSIDCLGLIFNMNLFSDAHQEWFIYPQNENLPTKVIKTTTDNGQVSVENRNVNVLQQVNGYPTVITIENIYLELDTIKFSYKTI
jgi:hypothetical protein